MKKALDFLAWAGVAFTIFSLIVTLITTYNVSYVNYFSTYQMLQWSIFFTMLFWAVKLFQYYDGKKKVTYPLLCVVFALGAILFMINKVL